MAGRHTPTPLTGSGGVPAVALSAGWGNTSTSVLTGSDTSGKVVVSASGSGQGASPTLTLTFADAYAQGSTPVAMAIQDSADSAKSGFLTTASGSDATKVLFTYQGTPSGTQTYTLSYLVYG